MASVTLSHVYKNYLSEKAGDIPAVEDVSLEVADREFVVLVGPSGCGKSGAKGSRHRDGFSKLRALSTHDCLRKHRLWPEAAQICEVGDKEAGPGCGERPRNRGAIRSEAE